MNVLSEIYGWSKYHEYRYGDRVKVTYVKQVSYGGAPGITKQPGDILTGTICRVWDTAIEIDSDTEEGTSYVVELEDVTIEKLE